MAIVFAGVEPDGCAVDANHPATQRRHPLQFDHPGHGEDGGVEIRDLVRLNVYKGHL